ncbi:MAG: hypothetical protein PHU51_00560 [Candidatus Nanoarchaeia archaeon]|jgi:hypothetical protein|nr:hypothetical protein [Candidatus Nanoarchaeia archaeon]
MAASLKKQAKVEIKYGIDKEIYDNFVRACSKKGFAPNVVVEKFMEKYNQTGQI